MTEIQLEAMKRRAVSRALQEEREKRAEKRRWAALIIVATAITYALTWGHYGLGVC